MTASKLTLILTPFEPIVVMTDVIDLQRRAHLSGPEGLTTPAGSRARCWLRLAQQGIGAVRRPLVGLSVPIMGRVCQRESDNGETGAMVCRRRVTMAGSQQSIALIAVGGEDDRIGPFVRWWPPSPHSGGPGEPKNRSVRPRSPSLRPDGAWTVPRGTPFISPVQERG